MLRVASMYRYMLALLLASLLGNVRVMAISALPEDHCEVPIPGSSTECLDIFMGVGPHVQDIFQARQDCMDEGGFLANIVTAEQHAGVEECYGPEMENIQLAVGLMDSRGELEDADIHWVDSYADWTNSFAGTPYKTIYNTHVASNLFVPGNDNYCFGYTLTAGRDRITTMDCTSVVPRGYLCMKNQTCTVPTTTPEPVTTLYEPPICPYVDFNGTHCSEFYIGEGAYSDVYGARDWCRDDGSRLAHVKTQLQYQHVNGCFNLPWYENLVIGLNDKNHLDVLDDIIWPDNWVGTIGDSLIDYEGMEQYLYSHEDHTKYCHQINKTDGMYHEMSCSDNVERWGFLCERLFLCPTTTTTVTTPTPPPCYNTTSGCSLFYMHPQANVSNIWQAMLWCENEDGDAAFTNDDFSRPTGHRLAHIVTQDAHEKVTECFNPFIPKMYVGLFDFWQHDYDNETYWANSYNDVMESSLEGVPLLSAYNNHYSRPDTSWELSTLAFCSAYETDEMIRNQLCEFNPGDRFMCEDPTAACTTTVEPTTATPPPCSEFTVGCNTFTKYDAPKSTIFLMMRECVDQGGHIAHILTDADWDATVTCLGNGTGIYVGLVDIDQLDNLVQHKWVFGEDFVTSGGVPFLGNKEDHFETPTNHDSFCTAYYNQQLLEAQCFGLSDYSFLCQRDTCTTPAPTTTATKPSTLPPTTTPTKAPFTGSTQSAAPVPITLPNVVIAAGKNYSNLTYDDCWAQLLADAREYVQYELNGVYGVCPCDGVQTKVSSDTCVDDDMIRLSVRITEMCGVEVQHDSDYEDPTTDAFKEFSDVLIYSIFSLYGTVPDLSTAVSRICVAKVAMTPGSLISSLNVQSQASTPEETIAALNEALNGQDGSIFPNTGGSFRAGENAFADVNECANGTLNDCDQNAVCSNLAGMYNCTCMAGYIDQTPAGMAILGQTGNCELAPNTTTTVMTTTTTTTTTTKTTTIMAGGVTTSTDGVGVGTNMGMEYCRVQKIGEDGKWTSDTCKECGKQIDREHRKFVDACIPLWLFILLIVLIILCILLFIIILILLCCKCCCGGEEDNEPFYDEDNRREPSPMQRYDDAYSGAPPRVAETDSPTAPVLIDENSPRGYSPERPQSNTSFSNTRPPSSVSRAKSELEEANPPPILTFDEDQGERPQSVASAAPSMGPMAAQPRRRGSNFDLDSSVRSVSKSPRRSPRPSKSSSNASTASWGPKGARVVGKKRAPPPKWQPNSYKNEEFNQERHLDDF